MSRRLKEERPRNRWRRLLRSPWAPLVFALVALVIVQGFVVKPYQVPSGSMEPTLQVGDRVLVNRLAYLGDTQPTPGDVVVFAEPESWRDSRPLDDGLARTILGWIGDITGFGPSNAHPLVKRVIAGPGQTMRCCDAEGRTLLDDKVLPEPAADYDLPFELGVLDCDTVPVSPRCLAEYRVPPGSFLMLGDHRNNSSDSLAACRGVYPTPVEECVRLVPREAVIGKVVAMLFPPTRWGADLELADN